MDLINEAVTRLRARRDAINQFLAAYELCQVLDGPLFAPETVAPVPETKPPKRETKRRKSTTKNPKRETKPSRASLARKAKTNPPPSSRVPTAASDKGQRVLDVMRLAGKPIGMGEIARLVKLPVPVTRRTLYALKAAGRSVVTGHSRGARWSLAKSAASRPQSPAAAQAEFETTWNGARERAGTAPKLSDVRQTS